MEINSLFSVLDARQSTAKNNIDHHVWQKISQDEHAKKKFIQKWSNLFDDETSGTSASRNRGKTKSKSSNKSGRPDHRKTGKGNNSSSGNIGDAFRDIARKERAKDSFFEGWANLNKKSTGKPSVIKIDAQPFQSKPPSSTSNQRIELLFTDMPDELRQFVSDYLNQHWDWQDRLASTYPLLIDLESKCGPKWRLDKIYEIGTTEDDAVPNSTLQFRSHDDPTMYSIWREEEPEECGDHEEPEECGDHEEPEECGDYEEP